MNIRHTAMISPLNYPMGKPEEVKKDDDKKKESK